MYSIFYETPLPPLPDSGHLVFLICIKIIFAEPNEHLVGDKLL